MIDDETAGSLANGLPWTRTTLWDEEEEYGLQYRLFRELRY